MCNLYSSIRTNRAALARRFMLSDNRMAAFDPLPAIFPVSCAAGALCCCAMARWGDSAVLLRDGGNALSVSHEKAITLWDVSLESETFGHVVAELYGDAPFECVGISAGGATVIAADEGGAIHIVDVLRQPSEVQDWAQSINARL
jgi:hypothetical protein